VVNLLGFWLLLFLLLAMFDVLVAVLTKLVLGKI